MSTSLEDLKNSKKVMRGLYKPSELKEDSARESLGVVGLQALNMACELETDLAGLSRFPSLMGEEAWTRFKLVEDRLSQLVAVQTLDEYQTVKGRKKRMPKVLPTVIWNCHAGELAVMVKLVSCPGETFSLARACWNDGGYPGDLEYQQLEEVKKASLEEKRVKQAVVEISDEDDSVPSLEDLFYEPSTSASTSTTMTQEKTTSAAETSSKKKTTSTKRSRRSDSFEISDESFAEFLQDDVKKVLKKKTRTSKRRK